MKTSPKYWSVCFSFLFWNPFDLYEQFVRYNDLNFVVNGSQILNLFLYGSNLVNFFLFVS
jgi:hypothetical protein